MSYEDIKEAQAKRAAKEAVKDSSAAKGRRGRKRKYPTPAVAKTKKARKSEVEIAEGEIAATGMEGYCSVMQF
jgi:hypothetical protein